MKKFMMFVMAALLFAACTSGSQAPAVDTSCDTICECADSIFCCADSIVSVVTDSVEAVGL